MEQIRPKSSSENETNEDDEEDEVWGRKNNIPLLDQHTELRKLAEGNNHEFTTYILKSELPNVFRSNFFCLETCKTRAKYLVAWEVKKDKDLDIDLKDTGICNCSHFELCRT